MRCQWIKLSKTDEGTPLYCLPFAGGTVNYYRNWLKLFSPGQVCLHALALPSREGRKEPLFESYDDMLSDVIDCSYNLPSDYLMFGYSLGALIAYDLLTQQQLNHKPLAKHFFVAGMSAPHMIKPAERYADYNDKELLDLLLSDPGHFANSHPELIDFQKMLLPALRNEHAFYEEYKTTQQQALDCNITVFSGTEDYEHSEEQVNGWQRMTDNQTDIHWFSGQHLFVDQHLNDIIPIISKYL